MFSTFVIGSTDLDSARTNSESNLLTYYKFTINLRSDLNDYSHLIDLGFL